MISDVDLTTIARDYLTDWESLRPYLGLNIQEKVKIYKLYPRTYGKQKQQCLEVWKEMKGNEATYDAFITAAEEAEHQQLADSVRTMLAANISTIPLSTHSKYIGWRVTSNDLKTRIGLC